MSIQTWWQLIDAETRAWLIEHNGEPLTPGIVASIEAVAGNLTNSRWWVEEPMGGPRLTDEAADWIEAVANGEVSVSDDLQAP